jgi:MFS family permease
VELAKLKNKPQGSFYYGWVIVFVGGLGVFFSGPGQTYSISVFIDSYIKEFGWDRSLVSSIYSFATLLAGLLLFLVGRLIDRFGQRKMSLIIGVLFGLACFFNSIVVTPVMLFIGFFFLRILGQGSMTLMPNTLIPQWFTSKRGRAFSFMAIGGFVSSALLPPLNAWLITHYSWEFAYRFWGVLLLIVFVPIVYLFIRNKPEEMGLFPDNEKPNIEGIKGNTSSEISWTLKEAMRTKQFWFILFCTSIPALVNTGLTFHLVSILGEKGIPTTAAALILSLMAIIGFPITLFSGFLLERIRVNWMMAIVFIGQILFILTLYFTESYVMAIVYGAVWGMIGGLERITVTIIYPDYFGKEYIGSIKGIAMTVMVIGSAFGPLPFGIAYDLFGGYQEILLFVMILPVLGFFLSLLSPKPIKETKQAR